MTLTWHRPGPYAASSAFTHYHDARGRLRFAFLYRSGERALIRTLGPDLKLLKEEYRESLKAAKKLIEKRAKRGAVRPLEPGFLPQAIANLASGSRNGSWGRSRGQEP